MKISTDNSRRTLAEDCRTTDSGIVPCLYVYVSYTFRSDNKASQSVTAREHFVFTDANGLLYHFIVEGNLIKDGSKIPPDVSIQVLTPLLLSIFLFFNILF